MARQFLRGSIKLVAHDGHALPSAAQFAQQLFYARIGCRGVETVVEVVLAKGSIGCLKLWVVQSFWHGPLHELLHAVADKLPHFLQCPLRHSRAAQGIVDAGRQVADCIEQRAVQVENIRLILFHTYVLIYLVVY